MKSIRNSLLLATLASVALLLGCAGQKAPATKAIADAEAALAGVRDDAAQYAASDLQSVESTVADLKAKLQSGDFKGILAAAPALTASIAALKDTAAAKKTEALAALEKAKGDWAGLSTDLPNMVQALQSRVDALSASKRLPKKLDAATFEGAKTGLAEAKSAWDAATAAAGNGSFVDAVAKANEAKTKASAAMAALGMTAG
jgi:hypothetical protein